MEGPKKQDLDKEEQDLKKRIDFLSREISNSKTPALKNTLLLQLEEAKKELARLEKTSPLKKRIDFLSREISNSKTPALKNTLLLQLEEAKKELARLEKELGESSASPKDTTTTSEALNKKFKVGFVDTTDVMKSKARDAGDAAMTMEAPENPEGLKGFKRFFKGEYWKRTGQKIWKHGLWRDYYRNKEIVKAREKILQTGNIFAGEGKDQAVHDKFVEDVMEQFTSEYEEAIHRDAGETRRMNEEIENEEEIKKEVKKLIIEYASGKISREAFTEEEHRIFKGLKADTEGKKVHKNEDVMHASNLGAVAEQVKEAMQAGTFLEGEDFDIDLIYGKSKGDVRTEAKFTNTEKLAEKLSHTKIGQFVNETTIAAVGSIVSSVVSGTSRFGLSMKAKLLPFIGTALVSASFAKIREAKKLEEERRQHAREMARGEKFDPIKMERRAEMEESRYQTMQALDLIKSLTESNKNILESGDSIAPETLQQAISALATIESQIQLSDRRNIDLIAYSSSENVISERKTLDIERAKMRVALRKLHEEGKFPIPEIDDLDNFKISDFESYLEFLTNTQEQILLNNGENGINAKDRIFNKMKSKKSWQAARTAFKSGVLMGIVLQEAYALGNDQIGIGESLTGYNVNILSGGSAITEGGAHHLTGLAQLKHALEDNAPVPSNGVLHEAFSGSHIKAPQSANMVHDPDGTYSLFSNGKKIADHLTLNPDQTLTRQAEDLLQSKGVTIDHHMISSETSGNVSVQEYINSHLGSTHEMHRDWYDNNTEFFDKNELRTQWGGEHGTGLTSDGKYVLDVSHMTPDGSFHNGLSANAQELMKEGKLKMLISLSTETQNQVFEVPIGADGHIIIDPSSEIGKIAFATTDGHAQFLGRFGEIGQDLGENKFRMLSTIEGSGLDTIPAQIPTHIQEQILNIANQAGSNDFDMPPFIPIVPRTPLEKLETGKVKREGPGGSGYLYHTGSVEDRNRWKKNRSPRLEANPDAILSQKEELKWYFEKQLAERGKDYITEIDSFVAQNNALKNLKRETKIAVCMPVAAAQEYANIYNTISLYSQQKQSATDRTVIVMNVNWPDDADMSKVQKTISEIERAKKDFPNLQIATFTKVWPRTWINERGGAIYGEVVKHLNDVALRAIQKSGMESDVYLLTNDADAKGMSKNYLSGLIDTTERNKTRDGFLGKIEWSPELFEKYPGFHLSMRMYQYMESSLRVASTKNKSIGSSGPNFLVKAATFAAIGGYNANMGAGADTDLGRSIKNARFGGRETLPEEKFPLKYENGSWIDTDPSRSFRYYREGRSIVSQWADFDQGGYQPRGDLVLGENDGEDIEKDFEAIIKRSSFQITNLIEDWIGFEKKEEYSRALNFAFPPKVELNGNKVALWEIATNQEGRKEFAFTEEGKTWIKKQLEKYKTNKLSESIYKRGVRGIETSKNESPKPETLVKKTKSKKEKPEKPKAKTENPPTEKAEKPAEEAPRSEPELKQEQEIVASLTEKEKAVVTEEMRTTSPENFEPEQARQDIGLFLRNAVVKDASGFTLSEKTKKIIRKLRKGVLAGVGVLALWASSTGSNGEASYISPSNLKDKITTIDNRVVSQVASEPKNIAFNIETYDKLPDNTKNIYLYASSKKLPAGYVVVDKPSATMFVFSKENKLIGTSPVILGKAKGESPNRSDPNAQQPGLYATTPAGKYSMGKKEIGQNNYLTYEGRVLNLYGTNGIMMHGIYPGEYAKRKAAIDTPTVDDNRMSWGCINIDKKDYDKYLAGIGDQDSVIYITPDNENYVVNPETGKLETKNLTRIARTQNTPTTRRGA